MDIGYKILRICFIISALLHFFVLFIGSFSVIEGEIDFKDYKLVQLMDLEPVSDKKTEQGQGEIIISKDKNIESKEFPKEEKFSLYLPFFKVARLPEFIIKVKPQYPLKGRLKGMEPEVIVNAYIDDDGNTKKVVVLKSGGDEFDNSVIDALYKSKFRPAISKEGKPVPVILRLTYKFELE